MDEEFNQTVTMRLKEEREKREFLVRLGLGREWGDGNKGVVKEIKRDGGVVGLAGWLIHTNIEDEREEKREIFDLIYDTSLCAYEDKGNKEYYIFVCVIMLSSRYVSSTSKKIMLH